MPRQPTNKCVPCDRNLVTRRENMPYQSLPGTVLVGVEVSRCPDCGEFEIAIPAIDELANAVIRKSGGSSAVRVSIVGEQIMEANAARRMTEILRRVGVLLLLAACTQSPQDRCGAPDQTTYSCDPLPLGSAGCVGGPMWQQNYDLHAPYNQDDPEKIFPAGCLAEVPDCNGPHRGPRTFDCYGSEGQYGWSEAL